MRIKTTEQHKKYWQNRKSDWQKEYSDTLDHPHRKLIVNILAQIEWLSLLEIGCNSGPNLEAIVKAIPGRQVGGVDINADAIELAQKKFINGFFKVNSADNVMMSDNSVDMVLSDMCLIYVDRKQIGNYVKEMRRLSRNYVMLCEFHSTSLWNRLALQYNSGYYAYDWKKLLKKYGFYDIVTHKLTDQEWPGGEPQKTFASIILAKTPKYY